MPIINLNRATVATLELVAGKTETIWWDDTLTGFALRIRVDAAGKVQRTYVAQYRFNGQTRKPKLGDELPVDAARRKAEKLFAQVLLGTDPAAEKEAAKIEAQKLTFSGAVQLYLDQKAKEVRSNSYKPAKLYLTGAKYFPTLHKMRLDKITRSDIAHRLDSICTESGAPTAGQARAHLSSLFSWGIERCYCRENPVIGTATFEGAKRKRNRVLSDDELRTVWNACNMESDFGRIVRLMILTGCRRQEIGGLRWSEFDDFDAGIVTIPGERTKNHLPLMLTLPAMAMDIIRSVPRRIGRDHLFGERAAGFVTWGHAKKAFGVVFDTAWTLHDIRRTLSTGMNEIGIEPHIVEAILNHVSGHKEGVAGVYNHAQYKLPKRNALAMWADHVASITSGEPRKVVSLHAA
jgi:integrase